MTQLGPLTVASSVGSAFLDRDSSPDANHLVVDGSEQVVTSAPFVVDPAKAVLQFDYQTGAVGNGTVPVNLIVEVLSGTNFTTITRVDGGTTRAAPNDSWKTARLSLSAFHGQSIRLRFTNAWGDVRSRIDQVYMLGSTQALATPGDTSSCLNRVIRTANSPWVFNVDVSGDDGLIIRNAILGPRLMAKEIALPYGMISFKNSQGTVLGTERFELKTKVDKGIKSTLLSCTVSFPVAYAQHAAAGPKVVITANYEVTKFKNAPNAKLNVSQVYEFYPEIHKDDFDEDLACEPSNETPSVDEFSHFSCARWKPIVRYEFIPSGTALLKSVTFAQRLHLTPDGEPLRGTMVVHDCEPKEDGSISEPCIYTDLFPIPLDLTYAPPERAPNLPGIKLMQGKNALDTEVSFTAVQGGQVTDWDNIHATWAFQPSLPVPLPPGCPECVHIHWSWANDFGSQFGDGYPQVGNTSGTPGIAGAIMKEYRDSIQDVRIALTRYRANEDDPYSVESTKKSGVAVLFFILVASHTSGVPSSYPGCVATIVAAAARVADAPGAIITATRIGTAVTMTENTPVPPTF